MATGVYIPPSALRVPKELQGEKTCSDMSRTPELSIY
jgi:hypothetical protein